MPYSKDCSAGGAIASLILERPLCVSCLARKASATEPEVLQAIERLSGALKLKTESWDRCRGCSLVGYTYSLTHQ